MLTLEQAKEKAASYFKGFNCSQSVLKTLLDFYEIDDPLLARTGSGFGGGIARQGDVCGAISGAVIFFGILYGMDKPGDPKERVYEAVQEFYTRFKEKYHSTVCKELCGYDLSTSEGTKKFNEEKVHEKICPEYVCYAAELAMEIVEKRGIPTALPQLS
jgi:C_GCAxxG_C_C family probable redox protein